MYYLMNKDTKAASLLEPYCEALASEIIQKADPTSVRYSVLKLRGETATKCKAFTNEEVGFVALRKLVDRGITLDELLEFFNRLGCREQFQRMLVLDAVIFNVDRRLGNIGLLVENDTQKPLGIAPNFDFNLSMLPYVLMEEFEQIGAKLLDYSPVIGNDFTRIGQEMLTSEIRRELIKLQGFRFSFRGNREFAPARVLALEEMVNRRIQAILRGQVLYTRDVFVPQEREQEIDAFDNTVELMAAAGLVEKLKETGCFTSVMEEIGEDNHVFAAATLHEGEDFINLTIRIDNMEISCDRNGIEAGIEGFTKAYDLVCRIVDAEGNGVK